MPTYDRDVDRQLVVTPSFSHVEDVLDEQTSEDCVPPLESPTDLFEKVAAERSFAVPPRWKTPLTNAAGLPPDFNVRNWTPSATGHEEQQSSDQSDDRRGTPQFEGRSHRFQDVRLADANNGFRGSSATSERSRRVQFAATPGGNGGDDDGNDPFGGNPNYFDLGGNGGGDDRGNGNRRRANGDAPWDSTRRHGFDYIRTYVNPKCSTWSSTGLRWRGALGTGEPQASMHAFADCLCL